MKTNLTIEVTGIEVDESFFSFMYKIEVNGKVRKSSKHQGTHYWGKDADKFKQYLEDGHAVEIALDKV